MLTCCCKGAAVIESGFDAISKGASRSTFLHALDITALEKLTNISGIFWMPLNHAIDNVEICLVREDRWECPRQ
jgi:hypothetical protein